MTILFQYIVGGLSAGAMYALASMGLTLIYKTTGIINLATGEMAMVSTFAALLLMQSMKLPYWGAVFGALVFAALLGLVVERLLMRRLMGANPLSALMMTVGLFMTLNGLVNTQVQQARVFPKPIKGSPFDVFGVFVGQDSLLILGVTVVIVVAMYLFFRYTLTGIALRSAATDLVTARLMGVPAGRAFSVTWMVASVLGALAGIFIAPTISLTPSFMSDVVLKAFTGAVLGGLGNLPGAIVGGLLVGVIDNLVAGYLSIELKVVVAFVVLISVLVIRPQGIMGAPARRRT
jgi:branched-chain amino acid transport system permease protein